MPLLTGYLTRPVLHFRPDWKDGLDHGQLDDHTFDSASNGIATPWKVTDRPKRTLTLPFIFGDATDLKEFRVFIAERNGRQKGFWVPTWLTDFEPVVDVEEDTNVIQIRTVGVPEKVSFGDQFKHLAVITAPEAPGIPGKMEFYEIVDADRTGEIEELTLDRGLDSMLVAAETVICGVIYARLAEDVVEYKHINGSVARVELKLVELPTEVEEPHEGTAPIYLYRLTRGSEVWRFTNWPVSITAGALVWQPQDIQHSEITQDTEFNLDGIKISVTTDDAAHPFRGLLDRSLIQPTEVEIFQSDAETLVVDLTAPVFKGRLGEVRFLERGMIEAAVSSLLRIGEHETPHTRMQRVCNLSTYSARCGVNPATFTTTGTLTAVNFAQAYIEAAAFGAKATAEGDPNWFALGKVTIGSEVRICVGQAGNRLYLNAPFRSAVIGNSASALAGDDKRIGTCHAKFNNRVNNLSWPYLPNENPQFEALKTPQPSGGKK
jgi:hypothetical protein